MNFYLDTNVLLSLFLDDSHSAKVDAWLEAGLRPIAVSAWAEAEFASVVLRSVRQRVIAKAAATEVLEDFDRWLRKSAARLDLSPEAGALAARLARDHGLKLTAPDALHLAMAMVAGATLVTLDKWLALAARREDHPVETP